jgi:hypothetical protein
MTVLFGACSDEFCFLVADGLVSRTGSAHPHPPVDKIHLLAERFAVGTYGHRVAGSVVAAIAAPPNNEHGSSPQPFLPRDEGELVSKICAELAVKLLVLQGKYDAQPAATDPLVYTTSTAMVILDCRERTLTSYSFGLLFPFQGLVLPTPCSLPRNSVLQLGSFPEGAVSPYFHVYEQSIPSSLTDNVRSWSRDAVGSISAILPESVGQLGSTVIWRGDPPVYTSCATAVGVQVARSST